MKRTSLIVAAYNRPEYLKQCLASIAAADLSLLNTILIVDDCSDNLETRRLIDEFELKGVEVIKDFSKENRSIKGSLLFACNLLYPTTDIFINLDSDAIIRKDFFTRLLSLKESFPGNLVTGFNCLTRNKDGSIRHHVLSEGENFNTKKTVGGLNMVFNQSQYLEWVKPALEKCIKKGGNWDFEACMIAYTGYGKEVVCAVPSVCQHIGIQSSMGHSAGGEPPDVAIDFVHDEGYFEGLAKQMAANTKNFNAIKAFNESSGDKIPSIDDIPLDEFPMWAETKELDRKIDWKSPVFDGKRWIPANQPEYTKYGEPKLQLKNVTLVTADCVNLERVFKASDKCTERIQFADVKIFTSLTTNEPRCENIIPIEPITSKESYSWWIMKQLAQHIKTSHLLIFQHDGYVANPSAWKDEWLQWDYIGAPWRFGNPDYPVGNGGFSLRSKKLMDIVANHPDIYPMNEPGVSFQKEEDHVIVRMFGKMLTEKYGIKFAPIEVAEQFAIEAYGVKPPHNIYTGQFGFHGSHVDFSQSNVKP